MTVNRIKPLPVLVLALLTLVVCLMRIMAHDTRQSAVLENLINPPTAQAQYRPERDLTTGGVAPRIYAHELDGSVFADTEFKNRFVRLLVVADCTPCVAGTLTAWSERSSSNDHALTYILSIGGDGRVIRGFLAAKKLRLRVLLDNSGHTGIAYNAAWTPRAFLIGPDGRISYVQPSQDTDSDALARIMELSE